MTVESLRLYLDRITDDGLVALHISNKFISLEPVVAAIIDALRGEYPDITARIWNDDDDDRGNGRKFLSRGWRRHGNGRFLRYLDRGRNKIDGDSAFDGR